MSDLFSSRLSVQRNRKHESKLQTLARDVASQEERETQRRQKLEKSRLEKGTHMSCFVYLLCCLLEHHH